MNAAQQRVADVERLSKLANKSWVSTNREILAYVAEDQHSFWKSMSAYLQLENGDEIVAASPSIEVYTAIIDRAFLNLLDQGTISLVQPISSLAAEALNAMRTATGIGAASVPAPVVALTSEQRLENEVIADFARLSGDAFRVKLSNNRAYRDCYRTLAEAGRIAVGAAPKAGASAERELAEGQRLVMVDPSPRYVSSVADGQIRCTANRGDALVLSQEEAQALVKRLKRGHFVQAAAVA